MTRQKLPGEPQEDEQLPTGNAGESPEKEGGEPGGKAPPLVDGIYFRGKHKAPPLREKEGVKPEAGEQPDAGVRRISGGK